jgi:putative transposase
LNELDEIIEQDNQEEAEKMMKEFINKWVRIYRSFYTLRSKIRNYLHFFIFSGKIRSYFRTTNWLERSFKELKDQIRIRGYMQSEESAEKFLYLFFKDKDEKLRNRKLKYSELVVECLKNL